MLQSTTFAQSLRDNVVAELRQSAYGVAELYQTLWDLMYTPDEMKRTLVLGLAALCAAGLYAQSASKVDFEMMTWPEVKQAIEAGKTTALIYNGGTEQRGPQNVNGGHTLMGHATVLAIAQKLGNAIAAPVMPFSVNNANAALPGTIGLTGPIFAAVNEQVAEQMIKNGFKNIVLMGDHGGGQKEMAEVAKKLDATYAPKGIRVVFCNEVYEKANGDFDKFLASQNMPLSSHAGIPDTSEMLYLGGDKGWVRNELVASAVGDPMRKPGEARDANAKKINNGIQGDARPSTVALGRKIFDMKVDAAVLQIHRLLTPGS
jgi:creatinine amidohydrolase